MGIQLPLALVHEALQAQFQEEDGWTVVAHYGSWESEHQAARHRAGLFDLSHRGRLEIAGPDRTSWLHNLLTNDIKGLNPGHGCYTAFLTAQARIRGDAHLFMLPGSILLEYEAILAPTFPTELAKYRISERLELHERTKDFGMLAIQGPQAPDLVKAWIAPAEPPSGAFDHGAYHVGDMTVLMARCSLTGDPGYLCFLPIHHLTAAWQHLVELGNPRGLTPCGTSALESLRIEAGRPRYGRDLDESILLPEAGLDRAVSTTKGCYLGQEFVVRVRDRGVIHRRLVHLALDGRAPAARGDTIVVGERPVGTVTSSAFIPTRGQAMALGFLHRDYWSAGTRVTVQLASGPCPATVQDVTGDR